MWGWKEILYLLVFVFLIVPVTVESLLYEYALKIIGNSLYAGVLMGFIMAVIFTTVVYLLYKKISTVLERYWNSKTFMERFFMGSYSIDYLNCS